MADNEWGNIVDESYQKRPERSWIDKQFRNTSMVGLVFFAMCCGSIALPFGIAGAIACQDPIAKRNAIIVLIISSVMAGLHVLATLGNTALEVANQSGR